MVPGALRQTHAAAGGGLEGDRPGPGYAHRRADRVGQDPGGLPVVHQPAHRAAGAVSGPHPRRSTSRRSRPGQRHPEEPAGAAGGDHPKRPAARSAAAGHPHRRALRRHPGDRAAAHDLAPAAHPHHHAGVALHPAHGRAQPAGAEARAHGHRRRDPRGGRGQARRPPGAVAGTAGRPGGKAPSAHRAERHPEAHGRHRPPAGRAPAGCGATARRTAPSSTWATSASWTCPSRCRTRSWGPSPPTPCGPRSTTASCTRSRATAPPWCSCTRAGWWNGWRTSSPTGWARARCWPTTAACRARPGSRPSRSSRPRRCRWWWPPRRWSWASTSATWSWSVTSARRAPSPPCCSASGVRGTGWAPSPRASCTR